MSKSIEEKKGINYTSNESVETRINLKINKNANKDDADAYAMLEYLKDKNINLSKHIRLLLALEYRGEIYLNDKYQVVDNVNKNSIDMDLNYPTAVTVDDALQVGNDDINDIVPPSDDDL